MIRDHEKDIAVYGEEEKDGSAPQIAAYAKETMPTLQKHLETARSIEKDLRGK